MHWLVVTVSVNAVVRMMPGLLLMIMVIVMGIEHRCDPAGIRHTNPGDGDCDGHCGDNAGPVTDDDCAGNDKTCDDEGNKHMTSCTCDEYAYLWWQSYPMSVGLFGFLSQRKVRLLLDQTLSHESVSILLKLYGRSRPICWVLKLLGHSFSFGCLFLSQGYGLEILTVLRDFRRQTFF